MTRDSSITYQCCVCGNNLCFTPLEFKEHLQTAHYCTEFKGEAKMTLHLDTATHYISSYECVLSGIKSLKVARNERETAFRLRQRGVSQKTINNLPPLMP